MSELNEMDNATLDYQAAKEILKDDKDVQYGAWNGAPFYKGVQFTPTTRPDHAFMLVERLRNDEKFGFCEIEIKMDHNGELEVCVYTKGVDGWFKGKERPGRAITLACLKAVNDVA